MYSKLFFYIFTSFLAFLLFASVVISSFPKSAISMPGNVKYYLNALVPQGWGFFTKSPRENYLTLYEVENDQLIKIPLNNSDIKNYFGLSRMGRSLFMEISIIKSQISESEWSKGFDKSISLENAYQVNNTDFLHYLKKGKYVIVEENFIPWNWANLIESNTNKFIIIECNG
ncbi:SdpA family antimicrobial peptide system protein [Aureibacter tunicatorum]|uniref:Antimicrobial peptide system SdpA family protein n=1 Tax=Aureibacter tunicatorum TaxID=866807 RepID=A0AAE3XIY7_9BACT|nr:SdpA family antimicrobial peptide system protein [Aureibacter tunicatorum]MDR6237275.1 antimicrobial peptide system SdpA family protein [Aureibacter tunicatorum]BDD06267.1 hypothetical protein AUTU_37500 [Aureibacter tunicatorum]